MPAMTARLALTVLLSAAVTSLALGDGGADPAAYGFAPADDARELQRGEWKLIDMKQKGMDLPKEILKQVDFHFTFKPDKVVLRVQGQTKEGTYRVNSTRGVKEIDITIEKEQAFCIYELNRDTLKIALSPKQRPRDFTEKGDSEVIFILERIKK
jgi:uncharacterized protein (TIGR03067 family)